MSKKYTVNKGFILQKIGRKRTFFDPESSTLYSFNETATYIFDKIKAGWDEEKIASVLVKKYRITVEQAKKDISTTINELVGKKIIKVKQ